MNTVWKSMVLIGLLAICTQTELLSQSRDSLRRQAQLEAAQLRPAFAVNQGQKRKFQRWNIGMLMGFAWDASVVTWQRRSYLSLLTSEGQPLIKSRGGINLGVLGQYRMSNRWAFRFSPEVALTESEVTLRDSVMVTFQMVGTQLRLPLHLRVSPVKGQFRPYALAGTSLSVDLGTKSENPPVATELTALHLDFGFGFQWVGEKISIAMEGIAAFGMSDKLDHDPSHAGTYQEEFRSIRPQMYGLRLVFE